MVVFEEIPNEITLAINITNCPCKCPGCHSKFLWGDTGHELNTQVLTQLARANDGITCICFMGGDANPGEINDLGNFTKEQLNLKAAWYSGMDDMNHSIVIQIFSYIKLGHYDEKYGPLNKESTNQRLYKIQGSDLVDITHKFWKKALPFV